MIVTGVAPVIVEAVTSIVTAVVAAKSLTRSWSAPKSPFIAIPVSPVGIVGVGGRDFRITPSLSRHQIMQWLHRLRHFRYDETTELSRRITELSPSLTDRALVIVLSDLHDPQSLPALKRLAQLHDCAVLQFQDPAELQLRGSGFFRGQEAETGRSFVTHGRQEWLNQDRIDSELKRGGIDHLLIRTDEPFVVKLRHFFKSRDLLGKGAR